MIRYLCLKASEFEDLLMLFADDVAAKVWNKMSYDKWKGFLKKLDSKDYPFVGIDFGENKVLITFIDYNGDAYEYDNQNFRKGDKSFGDFLFREYAHLLEDDTMTNSTAASALASTASSAISTAKTSVDGLTGTVSNSWSNINADKIADYSTSIADAISYSYGGTSAIKDYDQYVVKSDWSNHPSHNLTIDSNGNLMYDGKRILCADDNNEKENNKMKNFNFDFGPCNPETIRMSMYGLAIKNSTGTWVSYNPATKQIIDVDVLNFDGAKFLYKMPVALKEVKAGDIVVHNRKPMFVTAPSTDGSNALQVVDIYAGEEKCIVPPVNMFGFNFVTRVVSLFGELSQNAPSADAPFGNMLPFLLMNDNKDIDPMAMMLMMGQGGTNFASNPMMMYFLMKDGGDKDILPLLFMMSNQTAPASVANK
jgi:hypothetical protein